MNSIKFNETINEFIEYIADTMQTKNDEYTSGDDRLSNFRRAAHLTGITMEQANWGMMVKHVVSVADLVQRESVDPELWKEKLGDLANYCALMWAIVNDKQTVIEKEHDCENTDR